MGFGQFIECDRGAGSTIQFVFFTMRVDFKLHGKFQTFCCSFVFRYSIPVSFEFAHFEKLYVSAESEGLPGNVGVNVQHTAIIVSENTHPVVTHPLYGPCRIDPVFDFVPYVWFFEVTGQDVVFDAGTVEYAGKFRSGTGLAVSQPFAGHFSTVA